MSLTMHDPDLDDVHRPIVVVPRGWGALGFHAVAALLCFVGAVWDLYTLPGSAGDSATFRFLMGLAQLALFFLILWYGWGIPAFAVFKDGIKLDNRRRAPGRSSADPWSYGYYSWDEIHRCHWSPFQPGRLSIYLKAAEHEPPALLADPAGRALKSPPMVIFQATPAPHRESVEKAIRAAGRWDE